MSLKAAMQDVAKAVAKNLPKGTAFVVLAFEDNGKGGSTAHYASNGKREEVWEGVANWVLQTDHRPLGDN